MDNLTTEMGATKVEETKPTTKKSKLEQDAEYVKTQCYTTQEFKDIVKAGHFGSGTKILSKDDDAPKWSTDGDRLRITLQFADGSKDVIPFKAKEFEGARYLNQRSVQYFISIKKRKTRSTINDFDDDDEPRVDDDL